MVPFSTPLLLGAGRIVTQNDPDYLIGGLLSCTGEKPHRRCYLPIEVISQRRNAANCVGNNRHTQRRKDLIDISGQVAWGFLSAIQDNVFTPCQGATPIINEAVCSAGIVWAN